MIRRLLKKDGAVYMDGAMGTKLYELGLDQDKIPEFANFQNPHMVKSIHSSYIDAGADIILANTFNSNRFRLEKTGLDQKQCIERAVEIARSAAKNKAVALDIGPTGLMMEPLGSLSFEEAYDEFSKMVKIAKNCGCDMVFIESMYQVDEMRAAILAVKENSDLPVFASMTFCENEKTLMGTSAMAAAVIMESLGVDALGANCSFGPEKMNKIALQMMNATDLPVLVKANAGTPVMKDGKNEYMDEDEFADHMKKLRQSGVKILGGCCGTNEGHMIRLREETHRIGDTKRDPVKVVASSKRKVIRSLPLVVGHGVNSSSKKIKKAIEEGDYLELKRAAIVDDENGADLLDINLYVEGFDECESFENAIKTISSSVDVPLVIDSQDKATLECSLRRYAGKAIINGGNCTEESMDEIMKLCKKYGASAIFMLYDENGMARSLEEKLELSKKLLKKAKESGVDKDDIIADFMIMPVNTDDTKNSLAQMAEFKSKTGLKVCMGVSNSSYGFPNRKAIDRSVAVMGLKSGADIIIVDTKNKDLMDDIRASRLILGYDDAKTFIDRFKNTSIGESVGFGKMPSKLDSIEELIINGFLEEARDKFKESGGCGAGDFESLLESTLELMNLRYERQEIFIPELMAISGNISGFAVLMKDEIRSKGGQNKNILMACVKGDFHDLSKNISKVLHEAKSSSVTDLGVNVAVESILRELQEKDFDSVMLFALMTKSVNNMKETIESIRKSGYGGRIAVKVPNGMKKILEGYDVEFLK